MDGVINILKPPGMTSHDVVYFLRRQLSMKKIGHTGTLDPQASGVLPLCVGQATRLADYLSGEDKEYFCEMTLGITTTTQDAWGDVVSIKDCSHITINDLLNVLTEFKGEVEQITPKYSAVKFGGMPLYKRTRLGLETKPIYRKIFIYNIDVVKYNPPKLTFKVCCSKGTYVRTICHDLGNALGVGGHMSFLLRTRVDNFSINDSYTLEEISLLKEKAILPMEYCIKSLEHIILSKEEIIKIKHGQIISLSGNYQPVENIAVCDKDRKLQAIALVYKFNNEICLKPNKVFNVE